MNSAAILLYAFTSCISGFVSCNFFVKLGGHNWVWNIILTSCLFSVPFFVMWSFVNTVALAYSSTQALPFTTILLILFIWLLGVCVWGGGGACCILCECCTLCEYPLMCTRVCMCTYVLGAYWCVLFCVSMCVGACLLGGYRPTVSMLI